MFNSEESHSGLAGAHLILSSCWFCKALVYVSSGSGIMADMNEGALPDLLSANSESVFMYELNNKQMVVTAILMTKGAEMK